MSDIKILIVEDEAIVALDLEERLNTMGFKVCGTASSGEKAVLLAKETTPHVILMDMKLKGNMNGIESANKIKEKLGISSIFITAFSDDNTIFKIKNSLNKEYISKPFVEEELKEVILRTINKPS
jgi:DNA-binding NarL/FixJ family response regulator